MAPEPGRPRERGEMKTVALAEVKDDLSRYIRVAETEDVVITRYGKAAAVLHAFASEEDWFDYRLENDPRFLDRVERTRDKFRQRKGIRIEEVRKRLKAKERSGKK